MTYKSFLPEAPIPSATGLFRLLFDKKEPWAGANASWCDDEREALFYSRGRWAIQAIVRCLAGFSGDRGLTLFVPDYFCETALRPIRRENVRLVFYPICRDLHADWGTIERLTEELGCPHIFLLVHYFGFPCGAQRAYEYCRHSGAMLVEDCAHALLPTPSMGQLGDAAVYSLPKVLGVPDGGLLILSKNLHKLVCGTATKRWSRPRDQHLAETGGPGDPCLVWALKKAAQGICLKFRIKWTRDAPAAHDSEGEAPSFLDGGPRPTSKSLLSAYQNRVAVFSETRRTFYSILNRVALRLGPIARPLFSQLPAHAIPYVYPLWVGRRYVCALYSRLNSAGVPARSWPDLPPEVEADPRTHNVAVALRHSVITLPLHQSLSYKDIVFIGEVLSREVRLLRRAGGRE